MTRIISILSSLLAISLLTACSPFIPTMQMTHANSVPAHYKNLGTVKIQTFTDNRPTDQKVKGGLATRSFSGTGKIYSGQTQPSLPDYLHQVIATEAERTGIFTVKTPAKYVMTGTITSLTVGQRSGGMQENLISPLLEKFTDVADVAYHVNLQRNGAIVFSKDIHVRLELNQSSFNLGTSHAVSVEASRALDKAITESVRQLFNSIQKQLG